MEKIIYLTKWLQSRRGEWPKIAKKSGINYWFIMRLGQGRAKNPSHTTIEKLYEHAVASSDESE